MRRHIKYIPIIIIIKLYTVSVDVNGKFFEFIRRFATKKNDYKLFCMNLVISYLKQINGVCLIEISVFFLLTLHLIEK